ncbi:polysaccharide deacetylase family protein [Anaerovorax odorimutans]|uniref:polysaccharide deacetylase family protein n=1 Tax=Anaerovorax odorimutans TaxID=109327 RepID=UPI000426EE84|nr:polysaccharide deacetylase family protein [Anaerovorax odorimutans]
MYFGSVRFFKHLIVAVVLIIIIFLSITAAFMIKINKNYKNQVNALEIRNTQLEQKAKFFIQTCEPIDYQTKFPNLYVNAVRHWVDSSNTVYLTFDDGPSERTEEVLDILKEKNIKATFFVIGKEGYEEKQLMRKIVDEGHTIGIHTYSHKYKEIYASVEAYLEDFNKIYNLIYETTNVKPEIFRFPGGSINIYNESINYEIVAEMTRRGFTYYDWNATGADASNSATANSILTNAVNSSGGKDKIIMLLHDSQNKGDTVEILPALIDSLKSKGYKFDKLTRNVKPIAFNYSE